MAQRVHFFAGEAKVVSTDDDVAKFEVDIKEALKAGSNVVGFDMEWPADTYKGCNNPVALLQFAIAGDVWLVRTCEVQFPPFLRRLITDPNVFKVAIGFDSADRKKLETSFDLHLEVDVEGAHGILDLGEIAKKDLALVSPGLKGLAQHSGLTVYKDKWVTASDWAAPDLSSEQLEYAAGDAHFALIAAAKVLTDRRVRMTEARTTTKTVLAKLLPRLLANVKEKDLVVSQGGNPFQGGGRGGGGQPGKKRKRSQSWSSWSHNAWW